MHLHTHSFTHNSFDFKPSPNSMTKFNLEMHFHIPYRSSFLEPIEPETNAETKQMHKQR